MHYQQTFDLFGVPHLASLSLIALLAVLLPISIRRLAPAAGHPLAYLIAFALLAQETSKLWIGVSNEGFSVSLLPLQLCDLAVFLTAWMLISERRRVYEVVYYWGLGGSTQALLTPDLEQAFPHPAFLLFFIGHGLVVVGVLYATIVFRLRPQIDSIPRVALITLGLATAVFVVNLWLDTNFMYLMAKPDRPSLLDWFGPWPWYLVGLIAAALVSFFVLYAPFFWSDRWKSVRSSRSGREK